MSKIDELMVLADEYQFAYGAFSETRHERRKALRAKLAEVCRDAERYVHLRDHCARMNTMGMVFIEVPAKWFEYGLTTDQEDQAIDAAMKGQS